MGRVVEGLFLSHAGPKSVCSSYLIEIIGKETSDVQQMSLISVRYDQHPRFDPALDKNNPSTTSYLKSIDSQLSLEKIICLAIFVQFLHSFEIRR